MKRTKWTMIVLLILVGTIGLFRDVRAEGQKSLDVTSKIDKIMVYPDRALVSRQANLDKLSAGLYEVTLRDLPIRLQDDSVRVNSSDPDNLKIIGLDIKTYQLEKPSEEKVKSLQEQLQTLQDNIRTTNDNLNLLQAEKEYLNSAKETFLKSALQHVDSSKEGNKSTESRLSIKDYDEMLKYYLGKLHTNAEVIQSEELKRRDTEKKMALIREELSKLGISQNSIPHKKSVKVNIEVLKDGAYELTLAYINYGVNWRPSYDIRILSENKEMEITAFGMVSQNSGEDWLNAQLSFSTAQPALSGWMPELMPLYATLPEKIPHASYARKSMSQREMNKSILAEQKLDNLEDLQAPQANGKQEQMKDAGVNQYLPVEAASTFGNVVFNTPKRVDIPADGTAHRTNLWHQKLPVTFEFITTPKISPYVYLQTVGTNKTNLPILRGNINVFMGSDFIGNSMTSGIMPDEEFELTLSVDENIRVTRKLEEKEEKGPGFLSSTKHITYSFLIKLENYKKEKVTITVFDQIPVSQNKDVTIELGKYSDKPIEEGKDGKLKWKFELKPKEIKEITFSFTVYCPNNNDPAFYNNTPSNLIEKQQNRGGMNLRSKNLK